MIANENLSITPSIGDVNGAESNQSNILQFEIDYADGGTGS